MPSPDPVHEANADTYFEAMQFPDPRTGRVYAVWAHGVRTLLPTCDHVALVTLIGKRYASILVVPREEVARLAARWWRVCVHGRVRLEECPEDDWYDLVDRAGKYAVDGTSSRGGRR